MNPALAVRLSIICVFGCGSLSGARFGFSPVRYEIGPVDRFGYASLEQTIGDLELQSGRKLPLRLRFSSDPASNSSHFGKGYGMPLLESRIFPYDDWNLRLDAINGDVYYLAREDLSSNRYLTPDRALVAEMEGRRVSLAHARGWSFQYVSGSLRKAETPEGDRLFFAYRDGRVTDILLDGGKRVLAVKGRVSSACIDEIRIDKTIYEFTSGKEDPDRARGKTPYAESLYEWKQRGAAESPGNRFQFQRKEALMVLSLSKPGGVKETVSWEEETGYLSQAGDWSYAITPKKDSWAYAKIARSHSDGRSEMINRDYRKGLRERLYADGRLERKHFTLASGPLHWKLRKVEEIKDGITEVTEQRAYYEDGELMRLVDAANNITFYERDEQDRHVRTFFNDRLIDEKTYGPGGVLQKRAEDSNGDWVETEYRPDGQRDKVFKNGILQWYNRFDSQNRVVGQFFRSGIQRRFFYDEKNHNVHYRLNIWPDENKVKVTKVLDGAFKWSKDNKGTERFYKKTGIERKRNSNLIDDVYADAILSKADIILTQIKNEMD